MTISRLFRPLYVAAWVIAATLATSLAAAQANGTANSGVRIADVQVGFEGNYKVGHWTPVWIRLTGGDQTVHGRLELTVPDGDGFTTRTTIEDQVEVRTGAEVSVIRYVKPGRVSGGLAVEFVQNETIVAKRGFSADDMPAAARSTSTLVVVAGRDIGVGDGLQALRRTSDVTAMIDDPSMLPDDWFGYEAVDTLVLTTSQLPHLNALTPAKVRAIYRWVSMGGRLIVCMGRNGKQAIGEDGQGPLADLVPGDFKQVFAQHDTSGLEAYVAATERLDRVGQRYYETTELTNVRGRVLAYEVRAAQQLAVVVRTPLAFGQVIFVAGDLDEPPFSQWRDRGQLVAKLLQPDSVDTREFAQTRRSGKAAQVGYTDISGQLRAALDQFDGVRPISFFGVAALLVVYILLIGPADYFLLKRFARRMEWTWVSFPLLVASFGGLALLLVGLSRSDELHVNQVEVIDIDEETGAMRGSMWAHIYSAESGAHDLSFSPQTTGQGRVEDVLLSWQGLPGAGFGGMNPHLSMQLANRPYTILATRKPGWRTVMKGMPIQVSSSKTVAARWYGKSELKIGSRLTASRVEGNLRGSFVNPLPISLQRCAVYYGNTAYRLDGDLAAGQTIDFDSYDIVGKSLEGFLTQKRVVDSDDLITKWEHTTGDVPRILQMMMFHKAAGGDSYTSLTHRYHDETDLSDHLKLGRAILVGYSKQPSGELKSGARSLAGNYDKTRTWTVYRIVFPVTIDE